MFEKEAEEYANRCACLMEDIPIIERAYRNGAEFGYNKAMDEMQEQGLALQSDMDKTIEQNIALKKELEKANEWHKADVPTSPINKVVLGYIKDYNLKKFCLVKWNGEWWYDARTWNEKVKLIAWKEIVLPELPKESE